MPPKSKKRDREAPIFPEPSSDVVTTVMDAGGLAEKSRSAVAEGLAVLRDLHLGAWRNLSYYATDNQLSDGLAKIKKRSALLRDLLARPALGYALHSTVFLTPPGDSVSDRSELERLAAAVDHDIAGVDRLYRLACNALIIQDGFAKKHPNFTSKPSAHKPQDIDLARGIEQLWTQLGRSTKGRDAAFFAAFAARILEHIRGQSEVDREAVDELIKRSKKYMKRAKRR